MRDIELYSDGGAEPNPGKGGYGVILSYKGIKKEFSQGYQFTTNNRMELMGVIHGLEKLKTRSRVIVYSDSQYVINGIEKGWARKWKIKGWFRTRTEKASNYDLWGRLLDNIDVHEKVNFQWVKGHAGHPENERCDELAMMALSGEELIVDEGYVSNLDLTTENKDLDGMPSRTSTKSKVKVTAAGDPCRKCNTNVVKKSAKKKEPKPGQNYYFEYYLHCPGCKTLYMVEDAKRLLNQEDNNLFT
ncbi:MAG: ribonuclease HI [Chitinophagaceae bacterium]|nr:MAG: ribonuclease HI [Chitinophagaceae bacterium]